MNTISIRQLKSEFEDQYHPIFLSSWQRKFVWTLMEMLYLYDTIIQKMKPEKKYCDIDPIIIGRYLPEDKTPTLIYNMNYKNPIINGIHIEKGRKPLNEIRHLQDGQQRLTSILFMLYGDYLVDGKKKQYLYFNSNSDSEKGYFFFDTNKKPNDGCIKASELFSIFLNIENSEQRKYRLRNFGIEYDDVFEIVNHILSFNINVSEKTYRNISDALDDFRRKNSGHSLSSYELFINKCVEYVGDQDFDKFFEEARKILNNSIPIRNNNKTKTKFLYFGDNKKGTEDFALNLMTYRNALGSETSLKDFKMNVIQGTVHSQVTGNKPVNSETINEFGNRLSKFIKKTLNTTIKISNSEKTKTWETCLPYKKLKDTYRMPIVSILRHMGRDMGRDIDARNNNPLDKQAVRFLLHLLCAGHKARGKNTNSSKSLFLCNSLEEFSQISLEVILDEVDIEIKQFLVTSSINNNFVYVEECIFPEIKKGTGYSKVFRSGNGELLTNEVSKEIIEFLPPSTQRNNRYDTFLNRRKEEIDKRMKILLSEYDIEVK